VTDKSIELGNLCAELIFGVVITKNINEVVSNKNLPGYKPFLEGKDISRYLIRPVNIFVNLFDENVVFCPFMSH